VGEYILVKVIKFGHICDAALCERDDVIHVVFFVGQDGTDEDNDNDRDKMTTTTTMTTTNTMTTTKDNNNDKDKQRRFVFLLLLLVQGTKAFCLYTNNHSFCILVKSFREATYRNPLLWTSQHGRKALRRQGAAALELRRRPGAADFEEEERPETAFLT
jgi:hypothetical protein